MLVSGIGVFSPEAQRNIQVPAVKVMSLAQWFLMRRPIFVKFGFGGPPY